MPMPTNGEAETDEAWMLAALYDPFSQPQADGAPQNEEGSYAWLDLHLGWLAYPSDRGNCWSATLTAYNAAEQAFNNLGDIDDILSLYSAAGDLEDIAASVAENGVIDPAKVVLDYLLDQLTKVPPVPQNLLFQIAGQAQSTGISIACGYIQE